MTSSTGTTNKYSTKESTVHRFPKKQKRLCQRHQNAWLSNHQIPKHTLDSGRSDQPEQDLPRRVNPIYHPQLATKRVHPEQPTLEDLYRPYIDQATMSTPTATPTSTTPASNKRKESLPSSNTDFTGTTVNSAVPDLTTTSKHPNKKSMISIYKDQDLNMTITHQPEQATPFNPEDVDIKPDIGPATASTNTWVQTRAKILRRSSPYIRFRATWDGYGNNVRALESLHVTPKMIQRCKDHADWLNKYLIHLSSAHTLLLPSFEERTRGILWGTKGKKLAYIWNLQPITIEEENYGIGRFLRFTTHLPACGPIDPSDSPATSLEKYALKIDQGQIANPCWTDALCSKVKHNGSKLIGPNTFNGDLTYWVTEIPKGEVPLRLWKNPGSTQIAGMVCGWPICLELLPTCMICGSEDHNGARCSYEDYLISGPSPANEPDDDIMELSPMPTIKHKKKEKKAAQIEAPEPEPEVTHHEDAPPPKRRSGAAWQRERSIRVIATARNLTDMHSAMSRDYFLSSDPPTPPSDEHCYFKFQTKKQTPYQP
ncbi:hypothetical protein MJO28_012063 [Puccinia striiformis f. sp. tritici]|uniref:Uncharacterized protein n=1 Tax=Puccinia striiformis f. sp. tritici TaxID=168172 RepID=A0ACC0DZE6_9BASI|nr:hypothetical protein MJO28_012063 [Puccinia striiformis f. sp. tritici]